MKSGIINVYKEKGYTSHDVVAKLRKMLGIRKAGHTGTLDPEAEGVLPIGLLGGTKVCDMLTGADKEYEAELVLGITTDTEDMTGTVLSDVRADISHEDIKKAIESFKGTYLQTPPMYSAIKVNGKRLYELAREGKEIERAKREVNIRDITILSLYERDGHPAARIRVLCSKGTYIRTLCSDIGKVCGCGGVMSTLLRTASGRFRLEDAFKLGYIQELADRGRVDEIIIPVDNLFDDMRSIRVPQQHMKRLLNGNTLFLRHIKGEGGWTGSERARVYSEEGRFCGIYEFDVMKGCFNPVKMFL